MKSIYESIKGIMNEAPVQPAPQEGNNPGRFASSGSGAATGPPPAGMNQGRVRFCIFVFNYSP
jgi:hypothetical protein